MKINNSSKTKLLGALLLTVLEVQLFDIFEWIKVIAAFIPESLKTLIINSMDFVVVFSANLWLLSLFARVFRKIVTKSKFLSKTISWLKMRKRITFVLIFALSTLVLSLFISQIDLNYRAKDYSSPTITVTSPRNSVIKAKQYESAVVYHLYFEDETKVKKVLFDETFVVMGDCTANITIDQSDDNHYILSLNNIDGRTGSYQVLIKEGAVIDTSGNKSKEIQLSNFYLYNEESEVDITPPQLTLVQIATSDSSCLYFNLECIDDKALASVYIQPEDIIPVGFSANINVEITDNGNSRKIILSNLIYSEKTENCRLVISSGVATDMWGNKSAPYIHDLEFN